MKLADVVGHSGLAIYAEVGLILFFAAFVLIVARVFWPSRRKELEEAKRLPLDDGPAKHGHAPDGNGGEA